jgi:CRP-like cAMP-binding protein
MARKKWFRGSRASADDSPLTPDELILNERFEEARDSLNAHLRYYPNDLHAHLKLAEVYKELENPESCRQEYLHVASAYAQDGFYDKARAVLLKVHKLFPGEIDVDQKMSALQRAKRLEHTRGKARAGMLSTHRLDNPMTGRMTVEFEAIWSQIARTTIVDQISPDDLSRLFGVVEIVELHPGESLVDEGDRAEILVLIAVGTVEARVTDRQGHDVTLRSFGPGDIIGERAIFNHAPWPAAYRIQAKTKALRLDGPGLEKLILGHPNPRNLLDVLRTQGNDDKVARAARHLRE